MEEDAEIREIKKDLTVQLEGVAEEARLEAQKRDKEKAISKFTFVTKEGVEALFGAKAAQPPESKHV